MVGPEGAPDREQIVSRCGCRTPSPPTGRRAGPSAIPPVALPSRRSRARSLQGLASADLLLWPRDVSTAGHVLLEAQASGLPVLAASGNARDHMRRGLTGMECHADDVLGFWEAANQDDLFSVTSLKHYPYVANSDFHKPKHLHSWKTLLRCDKTWPAIKRALRSNVDFALTLFRNGA